MSRLITAWNFFIFQVQKLTFNNRESRHVVAVTFWVFFIIIYVQKWARWLKRQGAWLRAGQPGFDPGCRSGGDFSSLLRVQTGPGVHSTSYKMSTGEFLWR